MDSVGNYMSRIGVGALLLMTPDDYLPIATQFIGGSLLITTSTSGLLKCIAIAYEIISQDNPYKNELECDKKVIFYTGVSIPFLTIGAAIALMDYASGNLTSNSVGVAILAGSLPLALDAAYYVAKLVGLLKPTPIPTVNPPIMYPEDQVYHFSARAAGYGDWYGRRPPNYG